MMLILNKSTAPNLTDLSNLALASSTKKQTSLTQSPLYTNESPMSLFYGE